MNQHAMSVLSSCMQALRLGLSRCPSATAVVILPVWTVFWPETLTVPGTSQLNAALGYPHHLRMQKGKTLAHQHNPHQGKIAKTHAVPKLYEYSCCFLVNFLFMLFFSILTRGYQTPRRTKKKNTLKVSRTLYSKSFEFPFTVTNVIILYIY